MPQNKKHKHGHASKRSLSEKEKGRVVPLTAKASGTLPKDEKMRLKQQMDALRKKKQANTMEEKRLGSNTGPPRIVGLLAANESANPMFVSQCIQGAMGCEVNDGMSVTTCACKETKQRVTLCCDDGEDIQVALDVAKVADVLVLCVDVSSGLQETLRDLNKNFEVDDDDIGTVATWYSKIGLCITDHTRELVSSINALGSPSVVVILQGLETYENPKSRHRCEKLHTRYFGSVLTDDHRVFAPDSETDYKAVLRTIQVMRLRPLMWREIRPYMLVEKKSYDAEAAKLTISGYLRGSSITARGLIHLTNHGTYQMESIACYDDPNSIRHGMEYPGVLEVSTPENRDTLEATKPSDTIEEDNLATEADIVHEEMVAAKRINVPEGASDYQAAWYEVDGVPVYEDDMVVEDMRGKGDAEDDEEPDGFADFDAVSRKTITDIELMKASDVLRVERMTDLEKEEEIRQLREAGEEEKWNSDMLDTPIHFPARQRFSKYRGMKSFQTGKWDVEENLPLEYGHVFKLQGFKAIRDVALSRVGPAGVGMYVTITILDVTPAVATCESSVLLASGLLPHEQRWSVLHFHMQRNAEMDMPVKSKTPMLAHVGFRKFYCSPVYADATVGDRTKFSRFFHEDEKFKIATMFGPISYNPCPVLFFKAPSLEEQAEGTPLMLSSFGSVLPPNPDLLLLKRTVLSGRISVIYKKVVVVKFMFFNDDDVRWFQPIDLYTKLGRRGKITKAVGSKGLFKCVFNDIVMQHDVVCMDLYKRVFPKWNTVPYCQTEIMATSGVEELEDDE